MRKYWPYLLILLLVIVTYGNSLNNTFLSDDLSEIVHNPKIGSFTHIFDNLSGFIRPFLYWSAYQISGLNPVIFRSINLFFHIGSVFLVYLILVRLHSKTVALIAAAIFAVHPAISEAVVWISGGGYPQYTFFFLSSLFLYFISGKRGLYYILSIIFFTFSFMSHPQMPLALFLLFPLFEHCFGDLKKNWKKTIPYLLVTLIYTFLVLNTIPERTTTLQSVHYQEGGIDNPFILIPIAVSSYLQLIFFPKILTLYHSELQFSQVEFIIRVIFTLGLIALTFISFKKNKAVFFYLSLFWIALSPTLTPFRLNWIVAERYLYLPILGILIPLTITVVKLTDKYKLKRVYFPVILSVILILIIRTFTRNIDWKNEDNLWIATGKTSPSSPNTHNNLGDVYGRWGDKQKALQEFQTAINLKPNYADAYHNLGNTYRELGDKQKALENYQNALKYNPNLWQSYQNIAALYFEDKQYEKSLEYIQKAITVNPKNINLYNNLATVYLSMGDKQKAKEVFTLVLNADPQNQFAKQGLAETLK